MKHVRMCVVCSTHRQVVWCVARAHPRVGQARACAPQPGQAPPAPAAAVRAALRRSTLIFSPEYNRSRPRAHYFRRACSVRTLGAASAGSRS